MGAHRRQQAGRVRVSDPICVRCARPTLDGYACSPCAYRAGDWLHEIADLTPPARDVAHGFTRHGDSSASGKPGSRMLLNTMATQKLDQIQARLSTWVGEIAHGRNRPIPAPRHLGDDPIVLWARWLAGHVEWMRKTDDAERFLIEVDECVRVIRGVVRGPTPQKYLGPCGATRMLTDAYDDEFEHETEPCDGDVCVRGDGSVGRCGSCGAEVARGDREAWLDAEVRSRAFRAVEIEEAYGVSANLIRQWATPGRDLIQVHAVDRDGRALYLLSQVLDVAAAQKAKQAEAQAKRARQAAARAAESETAA